MPRPPNRDARRAQIIQGLVSVMARRGYDGASTAEIAKAAELTPGLIHYHFKNKQEILLAALEDLVTRHEDRLEKYLAAAPSTAPAKVAAFIDFHLGLGATADPDGLACWILMSGEALRQSEVKERYSNAISRLVGQLHKLIEEGVESQDFEGVNPAAGASAIVAAIQGYFVLAAVAREVIPRGSAARSVLTMAEGLLGSSLS